MTAADWQIVFDGEGSVVFDANGILLTPKAAIPGETHATLLLSKKTLSHPLKNFKMKVTLRNIAQLRVGTPNPWEVFWIFFNYTLDTVGKKKTNYALIKPNGIEIGKAFNEVDQEFLLTENTPSVQIGTTYTMTLTKSSSHITVLLNDVLAGDYESVSIPPGPLDFYDVPGAIGLYCEDAQVRILSAVLTELP